MSATLERIDLLTQARELLGHASAVAVMRAAKTWSARRDHFPRSFTQAEIEEILLVLIEQEAL